MKDKAHNPTASPNGRTSPNASARGKEMSDEMKAEDFPDTRPKARDRPIWLAGERWEMRVSCTTANGVRPRPKMKRPSVCQASAGGRGGGNIEELDEPLRAGVRS